MKWSGQHIYDLISRFRDDVYLEDLSTTTETNVLVVDSNGKVSKSTTLADDIIESEIDTLAGLTSFGAAGATTNIVAGDVTMYNTVNDGNPTISLGSSATNRLEISTPYNSGAQTLCDAVFTTYTASGTANDGRFLFYVDEVLTVAMLDGLANVYGDIQAVGGGITAHNTTTSSATEGGKLLLQADDGAAMADDHRLGVIEFKGAEDASNNRTLGASIEALCDDGWSASENGARLVFSTTDADASTSEVLRLDSDKLATFAGAVTATGALTGTLATASQTNITGVGTITTGSWRGTAITSAYLDADTAHLTTAQTFTGSKTMGTDVKLNFRDANSYIYSPTANDLEIVATDITLDAATVIELEANTNVTGNLVASESLRAKQIVLMRAAFKDDIGTTKHYIPLQSELEQTTATHEMNSFVAPYTGKLLKLMYRGSGNFSGGTFTFTLEKITRNGAFATGGSLSTIETITATGPTNNTTDPNMITVDFVDGSGTNAFVAGDNILVGIQSDTDVTSGTSKHFFTLVFEFDFSGLA